MISRLKLTPEDVRKALRQPGGPDGLARSTNASGSTARLMSLDALEKEFLDDQRASIENARRRFDQESRLPVVAAPPAHRLQLLLTFQNSRKESEELERGGDNQFRETFKGTEAHVCQKPLAELEPGAYQKYLKHTLNTDMGSSTIKGTAFASNELCEPTVPRSKLGLTLTVGEIPALPDYHCHR